MTAHKESSTFYYFFELYTFEFPKHIFQEAEYLSSNHLHHRQSEIRSFCFMKSNKLQIYYFTVPGKKDVIV